MIKILSIANSFGQDAQSYLYPIAKGAGEEVIAYNLYIGGCNLETHWNNYVAGAPAYSFEKNGDCSVREMISIPQALTFEKWDCITFQQVSGFAGLEQSCHPYIDNLVKAVKAQCPDAKLYWHETWPYEYNFVSDVFGYYENSPDIMAKAVTYVSRKISSKLSLATIKTGEVVYKAISEPEFDSKNGGVSLYRDHLHLGFIYGRYLASAVFYETLTGKSVMESSFFPDSADVLLIDKIKSIVHSYLKNEQ